MTTILPGLIDKWRNKRNGQRRYVGQVVRLADGKSVVIAEVYGETLYEMQERKHACAKVLAEMENDPKKPA